MSLWELARANFDIFSQGVRGLVRGVGNFFSIFMRIPSQSGGLEIFLGGGGWNFFWG